MMPSIEAPWRIVPEGDRSLTLILDEAISVAGGQRCAAVAQALRACALRGVVDIVPTFNSVAVHYQPRLFGTATRFRNFANEIVRIVQEVSSTPPVLTQRCIDIPVCYGGEYGPDLIELANRGGVPPEEVIARHSQEPAYVFMLGFAPGTPYIGMHDSLFDVGRRQSPRTALPAGSVAIANRQTVIYPNVSPGGWHVIGQTPLGLFFPDRDPPTLLAPGDMVRFIPIDAQQFSALKAGL